MTKMNGINLEEMTEQNLTADDIFNENFHMKRKKIEYTSTIDEAKKSIMIELASDKFGNHNKYTEKKSPQNLKLKSKFDDEYDINKIVESNIIIDKSDVIRLELRHSVNGENYKNGEEVDDRRSIENDSNDFSIRNNDVRIDGEGNGNEDQENHVSGYHRNYTI